MFKTLKIDLGVVDSFTSGTKSEQVLIIIHFCRCTKFELKIKY